MRSLAVLVVSIAALVALAGCAPQAPTPTGPQTPASSASQAPMEALTPSAKRVTIATSFPAEVPVPMGDFTQARAQGDSAWDYEVELAADAQEVAEWYRQAYGGREWSLVHQRGITGTAGNGTVLEFRKGNAQSSVTIYEAGTSTPTRALVTVGVGTPVLEVQ